MRDESRTGGPLKPGLGLSGEFRDFHSVHSDSISSRPLEPVAWIWISSNVPTLNFAKNAKFRMGHPSNNVTV